MQMETMPAEDLARAEARLLRWMAACTVAGLVGALLGGQVRFAAGFMMGAALAILNYFWLHQAVEALMKAGQSRPSKFVAAKFLMRYPLAFAAVFVFYRSGGLPFTAILAGLFVPAAGVLIEGAVQLREGFRSNA